jgi:hypothetical protein
MNLTLMCVQPCIPYYAWQIEVMLKNFVDVGVYKYPIHCLFAYNTNEVDWRKNVECIKKIEERYKDVTNVNFYYYQDTRVYPVSYISSIRPNLLKQHLKKYPYLSQEAIFYHDCDVVFTKFPDFLEPLCVDDNIWYVSNTKSYISHNYIVGKGDAVLNKMCEIVGIHPALVKQKEEESGGAQYLMKGLDWGFFDKMEKDCENLFKQITAFNNEIKKRVSIVSESFVGRDYPKESSQRKLVNDEIISECNKNLLEIDVQIKEVEVFSDSDKITRLNYHELQIWCSDMWAILWGAWMRGYETKVIPEMDFCWATDMSGRWNQVYIYHNAGVVGTDRNKLFFKGDFVNKYPYDVSGDEYDKNTAAFRYFLLIQSIGKNSCLVEKDFDYDFLKFQKINRAYSRFTTCKACENYDRNTNLCKLCGCQTEETIMKDEKKCPANKWSI